MLSTKLINNCRILNNRSKQLRNFSVDKKSKKSVFVSSCKPYDIQFFQDVHKSSGFDTKFQFKFFEGRLTQDTMALAQGSDAVVAFVNDKIDAVVVEQLANWGIRHIANRCAGYDHTDILAARKHGITVSRVPSYSPYAVAEHALALMLALNRHIPRAYNHVREGDFSLRGLIGFDMHGKTAGIVGTGKIGFNLCKILLAMGMRVIAYDAYPSEEAKKAGVEYVTMEELLRTSDVISLHTNLTKATRHLINDETISKLKDGVMIINTSRGGLLDTNAVIQGLKTGKIGWLGLDVYENEQDYFFEDKSDEVIGDDVLMRLTSFNNVIITSHQAYFTKEALLNIATETIANLDDFFSGRPTKPENAV